MEYAGFLQRKASKVAFEKTLGEKERPQISRVAKPLAKEDTTLYETQRKTAKEKEKRRGICKQNHYLLSV